ALHRRHRTHPTGPNRGHARAAARPRAARLRRAFPDAQLPGNWKRRLAVPRTGRHLRGAASLLATGKPECGQTGAGEADSPRARSRHSRVESLEVSSLPTVGSFRLSESRAARLRPRLERFAARAPNRLRVGFDPVQFPRRYVEREDAEVAGLLAASLAYGRVEGF